MNRRLTSRLGLALIALALTAGPTLGAQLRFTAVLKGANERPTPVDTNAAGFVKFTLNADETEITYRLIVANIDGVTQAHIHCGTPDVAGPVVVILYAFILVSVIVNGILAERTNRQLDLYTRPDFAVGPGGVGVITVAV